MNNNNIPSRLNAIPDAQSTPMNEIIPHYRRNIKYVIPHERQLEYDDDEEPETVFIDMKIDADDDQADETVVVNLFIDTKRNFP